MSPFRNAFRQFLEGVFSRPVENRRTPRSPFRGAIEVRTRSGNVIRGVARDLSEDGMGAILFGDLAVGESVLIKYDHPHTLQLSKAVARPAVVRSWHVYRYGFEFHHPLKFCAIADQPGTAKSDPS